MSTEGINEHGGPPPTNFPLDAEELGNLNDESARSQHRSGNAQMVPQQECTNTLNTVSPRQAQMYTGIADLKWSPDAKSSMQVFIRSWMESIISENLKGSQIQESYSELLPPETLFCREVLRGRDATIMYKEVRDLIFARDGGINKRRGLPIKRALAEYYFDSNATQDAIDLVRELIEENIPTLSARRSGSSRSASKALISPKTDLRDPEVIPLLHDFNEDTPRDKHRQIRVPNHNGLTIANVFTKMFFRQCRIFEGDHNLTDAHKTMR